MGRDVAAVACPSCGSEAGKETVYRVSFSGFTETPLHEKTYWREHKEYTEAAAELEYRHERMEEAAGGVLPTPPLARAGVAKAKELMSKGVKSADDWKAREKH